ncbi:hypothetical protein LCGC14_0970380 [marine sediment metagenome]|uniref:Uncharacterized protein n=1 Tax=marine sediment metagenome TaxID=412755 RepID=A0A0F9NGB2_9ZZZZ
MAELPPDVYEKNGQLYRDVEQTSAEGEPWIKHRPVALTLHEAKMKHWDWYHPQFGWVNEGYKLAKDRDGEDIMADGSQTVVATPEQQEQLALTESEGA